MAKLSKLAHVVYMTRRFEEMIAWYEAVFEAKVQYQNPAFAFLTYDDEQPSMHCTEPDDLLAFCRADGTPHVDDPLNAKAGAATILMGNIRRTV